MIKGTAWAFHCDYVELHKVSISFYAKNAFGDPDLSESAICCSDYPVSIVSVSTFNVYSPLKGWPPQSGL